MVLSILVIICWRLKIQVDQREGWETKINQAKLRGKMQKLMRPWCNLFS